MKDGFCLALLLSTAAVQLAGAAARAQTAATTRVSVSSAGANAHSACEGPAMSADGRFVAFQSRADNLVAGDTNVSEDVFLRDGALATTERVSVATNGTQGDSDSVAPSVSADGRFVAFASQASNLVGGDTNGSDDIFLRDRALGTTERVSVDPNGAEANAASKDPAISADGRFVAFHSAGTNLVAGDVNACVDVFLRDRQSGTTELISVSSIGVPGNGASFDASISADGRYVAFVSNAWSLVPADANGCRDVFVRDRALGITVRESLGPSAVDGNFDSYGPSISADGRFVAFVSNATNLIAGLTWHPSGFVRDRQNGTTELVNVSQSGVQGNGRCKFVAISSDGLFVAFHSAASNLIPGDTNGADDVFIRSRADGAIERMSVGAGGAESNGDSEWPAIASDGRRVVFRSTASNLVTGDTNGLLDVFEHDRGPQAPAVYCTSSTSTHGCSASISANSHPSISLANPCILTVTNVEGLKSGVLFYGVDNTGFLPGPWASGSTSWLCVKSPAQRTPVQNSGGTFGGCDGDNLFDWNAYQAAHPFALGNPPAVGARVYVQAWFRDLLAVKSTNLSNAIELMYVP